MDKQLRWVFFTKDIYKTASDIKKRRFIINEATIQEILNKICNSQFVHKMVSQILSHRHAPVLSRNRRHILYSSKAWLKASEAGGSKDVRHNVHLSRRVWIGDLWWRLDCRCMLRTEALVSGVCVCERNCSRSWTNRGWNNHWTTKAAVLQRCTDGTVKSSAIAPMTNDLTWWWTVGNYKKNIAQVI